MIPTESTATVSTEPPIATARDDVQASEYGVTSDADAAWGNVFESLFLSLQRPEKDGEEPPRLIGITSLSRAAGTSTVALNLAFAAIAEIHGQVALVDANPRHPAIHRALAVTAAPGLTDYLHGAAELNDCLHPTAFDRLAVLPVGDADVGGTRKSIVELIEFLDESYSVVIVDLPPVSELNGLEALARNLHTVLIVLPEERTEVLSVRAAARHLRGMGVNVRGIVLNAVESIAPQAIAEIIQHRSA